MAARRLERAPAPLETAIQAAVVDHWRALGLPNTLVAAIPNMGAMGQSGLTRGLPDLIVLGPNMPSGQPVSFIELKRTYRSPVSDAQRDFGRLCATLGVAYAIAYGRDQPIGVLEDWNIVRPFGELRGRGVSEIADANQEYGALTAEFYVAEFTFERAMARVLGLLNDGAWRQIGNGFDDVNAFVRSLQLDQFKAVAEQRREFRERVKKLQPEISNRAIADAFGVVHDTIDRDASGRNRPSDVRKRQQNGKDGGRNRPLALSGGQAAKLAAGREARLARDQAANENRLATVPNGPGSIEFRRGDFRAVMADLKDVDAIITDPPYGREFLPLMRDLAAFADRVLKPDGVLAVLYGQTWLPEAMALMSGFRPWRWMSCYLTPGPGYVSHARRVSSDWKPILIYGGGPRFGNVVESEGDGEAKERHPWGQDYQAFADIIEALTAPGAAVVDPFAGGGTTLMAAKALGRHAIGCDIDPRFAA